MGFKLHAIPSSVMKSAIQLYPSQDGNPSILLSISYPLQALPPLVTEYRSQRSDQQSRHHSACIHVILIALNNDPQVQG